MNLANFDPSSLELVKYITSSHWYHPTTLEQWVEPVSILIFSTLCFIFLRWLYGKFPDKKSEEPASTENTTPNLWKKIKSMWCRYWRCLVKPLLFLAYIGGICLAIQHIPLYTTEFDVIIRTLFSIASSLCTISILNNFLEKTDPATKTYKFIKMMKWKFVLMLLFTLIYPVVNNPVFRSADHIYLIKLGVRCLICLIACLIVSHISSTLNNSVLHKLKWPIFIVLSMTIILSLFNNLLPKWAQITRYFMIMTSLCYIIYIAFINNLEEIYPHRNTWLYYIIIAFRYPLLYTTALRGFGYLVIVDGEITSTFTLFETIYQIIPIIGFWYGVNSLFSYNMAKQDSGSFLELIYTFFTQKNPSIQLTKIHKQALIILLVFLNNVLFLILSYNILQRYVGIKPPLFYSLFFLILWLRYDSIYELLKIIAHMTSSFVLLLLIRCFKRAVKFALLLCFIYYNVESMPFTFPEGDKAGEILHHISVLLCFAYGIWQFTAPQNITFILDHILDKEKETPSDIDNNQETLKTPGQKIYPLLISHTFRTITTTGILLALFRQCGYDLDTFAACVSAILVAIGFIIQEPITNYFNSIILMKDRPLSKGDWVIINDIEGEVMDITYRCTAIKKFTQEYVYIPNNTVMSSPIINLSKMQCRPYEMNFNLAYSLDPEILEKILEKIRQYLLTIDDRVNEYEPRVYFNSFGDSAAQINVMAFIQLPKEGTWLSRYEQWLKIKHEVNLKIINIVKANGAEIATA